jgi:hypothetical protein
MLCIETSYRLCGKKEPCPAPAQLLSANSTPAKTISQNKMLFFTIKPSNHYFNIKKQGWDAEGEEEIGSQPCSKMLIIYQKLL